MYKVKSAFSGKEVISIIAQEPLQGKNPYKIYGQEEWKSDKWDPLEYGRPYDFQRPFFQQFGALQHDVPRMSLISLSNENSDYSTGTGFCKNCYLINSSEYCEDCYYGKLFQKCKHSVDCSYLYDSQLCYECLSVYNSYGCQWVSFSQNCQDCLFSSSLKSCKNCCLCTNLDRKEYHFLNQPLSKAEYEDRLRSFCGSYERTEQMKKLLAEQMGKMIRKYANIVNCENCTGDHTENSRNCLDCYDMTDSQDCRYVCVGVNVKDNYDCSNMYLKPELCYETLGTVEVYGSAYCLFIFNCQRMLYCDYCYSSSDCFGCSGLTRKHYCIFNKQYSKEEYEDLVPRIIEHMKNDGAAMNRSEATGSWGQYFPSSLSPFGYNETLANEYFPLTKEEAAKKGFLWREKDARDYKPQTTKFPEKIMDAGDSITKEIFSCRQCAKNFRIIPQELAFYRQNIIPIPRLCPDCRYDERLTLQNPRKLWKRECMKCGKGMETTYAPNRPETVYCGDCYVKEVY